MSGDLLLTGIGEVVSNDERFDGPLGIVADAAVAVVDGAVVGALVAIAAGSNRSRYF